jgi:predicted ATPase
MPADVTAEIVKRTDGVPLFVEEMTKAVLEAESEGAARPTVAAVPSPSLAVPASLHASLMARLDRLGPAREVAQIGAAIGREFSHALLASVARRSDTELASAFDRLVQAGLLFRQGVPPHASYLFKHALVQDAAYGTLLRERRRTLHARIADALESDFAEIAESQPEILARHCTEAGLIEKAAGLWGKAGQRSIERSALVEAVEQLTRALAQIASLPATPALRREEIRLQAALISPLLHVKGYAAPETKAAAEQARRLVKQAELLGDPPQDPLLMFSVLWGVWLTNLVAFKGEVLHELSAQFFMLAEKEGSTLPLMVGHRMMGTTLQLTGDNAGAIAHYDKSLALYDPAAHRLPAMRFVDARVAVFSFRALTLWVAGYPDKAVADTEHALKDAREMGQAAALMLALCFATIPQVFCGNYATVNVLLDELLLLAGGKRAFFWNAFGIWSKGSLLTLTGKAADAVQMLTSGLTAWRSMEATLWKPLVLTYLTTAYAELGQFKDALRSISDAVAAVETTKECWYEAEIHRTAGEIELKLPARDEAKAAAHFERALAVAREQQAKSLELRAAMSMARLLCSRGKQDEARDLLAAVYGWFTEGFDTLDLKQAKTLLDTLA